jgi:hypothetical protein
MRQVQAHPDRAAGRADFNFSGQVPAGLFTPGTPEFLFWQCREAALTAIDLWEQISGAPYTTWQSGTKIDLLQDAGVDLNAFYDRASLSFFHQKVGTKTYFSGASTDVVAHEAGHGFLDALRPTFIQSNVFEVNAFHEAFGDCVAILTGLLDSATRTAVLPDLAKKNGLESTAEELSFAISKAFPGHNAGAPRRALNKFQWAPPGTLPTTGGPGVLIAEIHSFGQVFSGCFYDLILNIFNRLGGGTSANLLQASMTAGKLLVNAATQVPQRTQFFREVGRTMLLVDQQLNGGANVGDIRSAFQNHALPLGSTVMLAPQTSLAGAAPVAGKIAAVLKKDLLGRLRAAPAAKLAVNAIQIAGNKITESIHERLIGLGHLHSKLKGVMAMAQDTVLLGDVNAHAVVLGEMPDVDNTAADVELFVKSLLENNAIQFGAPKATAVAGIARALAPSVTHVIKTVRGQKVLTRVRYACRGCSWQPR